MYWDEFLIIGGFSVAVLAALAFGYMVWFKRELIGREKRLLDKD